MNLPPFGLPLFGIDNMPPRKYRWTIELDFPSEKTEQIFCRVSSRPDPEQKTVTTIFHGPEDKDEKAIYAILSACYDFANKLPDGKPPKPIEDQFGTIKLRLWDGCGVQMEEWTMSNAYSQSVNFGELDFASCEEVTIEVTWKFQEMTYQNMIPKTHDVKTTGSITF